MRRGLAPLDSRSLGDALAATEDALLGGRVRLLQPARGHRVTVDTLLLASFAAKARPSPRRLVDLGAASGALALVIASLADVARSELVERDPRLVALGRENLARAGLAGEAWEVDLARGLPAALHGAADLVVANPPYHPRAPAERPDRVRQAAREGELSPFLAAASAALGRRGLAAFVYPARSLSALLAGATARGLAAKRLRFVHARAADPARVALVELRRGREGGLVVEPPLHEWEASGVRSAEVAALVEGRLPLPRSGARQIPSSRSR